jgi:hypothetical protein
MRNDSVSRDEWLVEKAKECLKRPDDFGWFGDDDMFVTWSFAGINHAVNSDDVLQKSNFGVISRDLMERFPDDFDIVGVKHWAVGSMDQLRVRVLKNDGPVTLENLTEAFDALMEWHEALMDYPIADEMDFSELEYDQLINDVAYRLQYDSNLKGFIFAEGGYEELAGDLIYEINQYGYCSYSEPPSDEELLETAFDLGLCPFDEAEFWNEWADDNKKVIVWNHYTNLGGRKREIPGQLKLEV